MISEMYHLLLVTLLAFALVDTGAACRSARSSIIHKGDKAIQTWDCPPDQVLFEYRGDHRCFETCEMCPNGFIYKRECHCFPGTSRDSAGICGKICNDCENGWCSSVSKCECNEGFTLNEGLCVPIPRQQFYRPPQWNSYGQQAYNYKFHAYPHYSADFHPHSWHQRPQYPPHMYPNYPPQPSPGSNPQLAPEATPQSPSQYPPHDSSSVHRQQIPESPLQPDPETSFQSPSHFLPEIPLSFKPGPKAENSSPQHRSCQTDYMWDPETKACVPYESVKALKMDIRTD